MLPILLNTVYLIALIALSPWLIWKALTTGKYRRGIWQRLVGIPHSTFRIPHSPVWFHAVSVGEVHLLRPILAEFRRRHPDIPILVSSTTDTGLEEAQKCFPGMLIIRWPLDFSWAVGRMLNTIRPRLLVLAESELWPNLVFAAKRRGVPVVVVNARMSPRSFRRLSRFRWLVRRWFSLVEHVAAQTNEYAAMFENLGVPQSRISVTGSVKYDGVQSDRENPKTVSLRRQFGLVADDLGHRLSQASGCLSSDGGDGGLANRWFIESPSPLPLSPAKPGERGRTLTHKFCVGEEVVWVAGSTAAPEEEICLRVFQKLQCDFPNLRLILVPRQRERFAEVAALLEKSGLPFVRRSELAPEHIVTSNPQSAIRNPQSIILLDTIGELGAAWGLADIAFVGGSLDGKRGGQNMIEPATYGAAVVVGPHTWNFRETVQRLLEKNAATQVGGEGELEAALRQLIGNASGRTRLGSAARAFVLSQQGATARTIDLLDQFLPVALQSPATTDIASAAA